MSLQILQQSGNGLIGLSGHPPMGPDQIVVGVVPIVADVGAAIELDEAHAALDEPPCEQALPTESSVTASPIRAAARAGPRRSETGNCCCKCVNDG